jgi:anaerobic ribonucleoside-triphosphate reductase activating protein
MNYAEINKNDIVNGEGISVSLFVSGCPHHCPGCFNPEAWDYDYGKEFTEETLIEIIEALGANQVHRNFSILGGEPLAPKNRKTVNDIIHAVRRCRDLYPKIYLWTGYTLEELQSEIDPDINEILENINVLIDGKYVEELRDLGLPLRGSSNQRVLKLKN